VTIKYYADNNTCYAVLRFKYHSTRIRLRTLEGLISHTNTRAMEYKQMLTVRNVITATYVVQENPT